MKPAERTLTQLKYSGGLRLIHEKAVVDAIVHYDSDGKSVVNQQIFLEKSLIDLGNTSFGLLNFKFYDANKGVDISKNPALLVRDKQKVIEFSNRVTTYGGATALLCSQLEKMNLEAVELIGLLRKEYDINE